MWTSSRRNGATADQHLRAVGAAIALLACAGLTACTAAQNPEPSAPAETAAVAAFPDTGAEVELDAGTYLVTSFTVPFEITVPDGWWSFGWGLLKQEDSEGQVFVNFLPPTSVPTDACGWRDTMVDIELTPQAYADAMAAQSSTQTTTPVAVTMGDFSGFEFDYGVESDVDFADCDSERICLFADSGESVCTRVHGNLEERETQRALDLNGELAMIAVGQFHDVDQELTDEARAVFDSIVFVTPNG